MWGKAVAWMRIVGNDAFDDAVAWLEASSPTSGTTHDAGAGAGST